MRWFISRMVVGQVCKVTWCDLPLFGWVWKNQFWVMVILERYLNVQARFRVEWDFLHLLALPRLYPSDIFSFKNFLNSLKNVLYMHIFSPNLTIPLSTSYQQQENLNPALFHFFGVFFAIFFDVFFASYLTVFLDILIMG